MLEDFFDQIVLTKLVRRNIEEEANQNSGGENRSFFGSRLAPLTPVQARHIKVRIAGIDSYGLGQYKAPDATPPLTKAIPSLVERVYELVQLEEMERFTGEEWMLLNSNDEAISRGAMLSLTQRMTRLQNRNDRLTEKMRWDAFKGSLTCSYPDAGDLVVDYGFTNDQLPSAGTAWTDTVNSDPVADLRAWSAVGADLLGAYYSNVHLNTNTWYLITRNQKIRSYLSSLGRSIMLPTRADLQQLMREGTSNFEIVDSGYLPEGATTRALTKFLPDNRVLVTSEYVVNGQRIAEVPDGQVLIGGNTGEAPATRQGVQSEILVEPFSKNVFRRQASARMVVLNLPEAFLYAEVGS